MKTNFRESILEERISGFRIIRDESCVAKNPVLLRQPPFIRRFES